MLLVDIGNSRIKWAQLEGTRLAALDSVLYRGAQSPVARLLAPHWDAVEPPERVLVSNVGGAAGDALAAYVRERWHIEVEFMRPRARGWGVCNAYPAPGSLGADRWAALVAARDAFEGSLCIVDCGTAVTIDGLEASGRHLGGLIIPGSRLMRRALASGTQEIGETTGIPSLDLASNTGDAVAAGTANAIVGAIERVARALERRLGRVKQVITGGDAEVVNVLLAPPAEHRPHLTLEGLSIIARRAP